QARLRKKPAARWERAAGTDGGWAPLPSHRLERLLLDHHFAGDHRSIARAAIEKRAANVDAGAGLDEVARARVVAAVLRALGAVALEAGARGIDADEPARALAVHLHLESDAAA